MTSALRILVLAVVFAATAIPAARADHDEHDRKPSKPQVVVISLDGA
jgi:hypothetical protein